MTVQLSAPMAFQRRVLIVEDDGFVRGLMTQVLTASDFDVRAASDVMEASLTNSASSLRALQQQDSPLGQLTATQIDILRLMALGWSNAEIAERRGSTQRSVEQMVHKIFRALGVKDDPRKNARVEAVKLYAEVFGIPAAAE